MTLEVTDDNVEGICECCREEISCKRCKDGGRSYIFCERCLHNMKED